MVVLYLNPKDKKLKHKIIEDSHKTDSPLRARTKAERLNVFIARWYADEVECV